MPVVYGAFKPDSHVTFLPSATKLQRLCFYRCVSGSREGAAWSGVPGKGVSGSRGVPGLGGGIPACTEADPPLTPQ